MEQNGGKKASYLFFQQMCKGQLKILFPWQENTLFIHYFLPECLLDSFCLNFNIFTVAMSLSLEINIINLAM